MKIYITVFLFMFFLNSARANDVFVMPDRIKDISSRQAANRTVPITDGKMTLGSSNFNEIFHIPPKKVYTQIVFLNQFRRIVTDKYKDFINLWIKAKYASPNVDIEDDKVIRTANLINKEQINLFYEQIIFVYRGKTYDLLVQRPVANRMRSSLKNNQEVIIEIVLLGYSSIYDEIYGVVSDFNVNVNDKNFKKDVSYNSDAIYNTAKTNLRDRKYDLAISKFKEVLTKNPNSIELRNDICAAEYMKAIYTNTLNFTEAEKCYRNVIGIAQSPDAYYGLASIYYMNSGVSADVRRRSVLNYSTAVINLLQSKENNLTESEVLIYYNSLYLRGLIKLELRDATAYEDLDRVERERPDLINLDFLTRK